MQVSHKHELYSQLASVSDGGVIVEIGVNKGNGLIALSCGNQRGRNLPIYGFDPYLPCKDDFGTDYSEANLEECEKNLKASGVSRARITIIREDGIKGADIFWRSVALLILDLGMAGDIPKSILKAWDRHIMPGGVIVVSGLDHDRLDAPGTAQVLLETGKYERCYEDQNKCFCIRKKVPSRAVFYIVSDADNGRFQREANRSAGSVKTHMLTVKRLCFTEGKQYPEHLTNFDSVETLKKENSQYWYLNSTRYFHQALDKLTAFGQLLYLDSDTYMCCNAMDLWILLNEYDLALAHEPQREMIESAIGTPASFSSFGIGVNLFRCTYNVMELWRDWLYLYEKNAELYGDNDQAPLRDCLYKNRSEVKYYVLTPEYSARFDFGGFYVGRVRILHGRVGGFSQEPLQPVCDEINSNTKMRIWNHGLIK